MSRKRKNGNLLFHISWWEKMEHLDVETRIMLLSSIIDYVETGNIQQLQGELYILFEEIRRTIDSDRANLKI